MQIIWDFGKIESWYYFQCKGGDEEILEDWINEGEDGNVFDGFYVIKWVYDYYI